MVRNTVRNMVRTMVGDKMGEETYYCNKCRDYVVPVLGFFHHPDLGQQQGVVCPKCGTLVYLKDNREYA